MALEFTLHSTMFSINLEAIDQRCVPDVLYIPLCFLLIPARPDGSRQCQRTLHSTMFSINLRRSSSC